LVCLEVARLAPGDDDTDCLAANVILRRYLFREIGITFAGVFLLVVMILISLKMVDYLAQAAAGRLPVTAVLSLVGLVIVSYLSGLIPICLLPAIMLAVGRMQRDNEITAMAGAGIGGRFLHRNIAAFTSAFVFAVASCSLFLGPWATREMRNLKVRAEQESDITGVTPGRFKEFSEGDRVLFVRSLTPDKQRMEDVFLQERDEEAMSVLAADNAVLATEDGTGHRFALFYNGSRYKGVPGQADFEITHYETLGWRIDQGDQAGVTENTKSMPTLRLVAAGDPASVAELQWRLSAPVLTFLLSVFAVSLLRHAGRHNRYGALLIAVLVYFTYSNLLGVARTLVKKEEIPGVVGLWWVHLLILGVILLMEYHPQWLRWLRSLRPPPPAVSPA
jgi:lipopolysaccharide export system permease protein